MGPYQFYVKVMWLRKKIKETEIQWRRTLCSVYALHRGRRYWRYNRNALIVCF